MKGRSCIWLFSPASFDGLFESSISHVVEWMDYAIAYLVYDLVASSCLKWLLQCQEFIKKGSDGGKKRKEIMKKKKKTKKNVHCPGIEPGSQEWESCMMPLH